MSSPRRSAVLLLVPLACASRPLDPGNDEGAEGSSEGDTRATLGATEGPTTAGPEASTSATSTTGDPSSTSASSTTTGDPSSTSASTTTTGPPATCGPACDDTWELDGDLFVPSWGDPPIFFHCLTAVHGDLTLDEEVPEAVLDSLANLRRVDGALELRGHATLTDLDAFACLERVEVLSLAKAPALTDLTGLAGLRAAPSVSLRGLGIAALPAFAPEFEGVSILSLADNPALSDLSAASAWGPLSGALTLTLDHNAALTDLSALGPLLQVPGILLSVQITDHPALTSLAGLEPVEIQGLYLTGLPQLADLAPLETLTKASDITLDDLPQLTSLAGLHNLTEATRLVVGGCIEDGVGGLDGLTSLAGLDGLTSVGELAIANNGALTSLAGAPALEVVNFLSVVSNPALPQAAYQAFLAQLDPNPLNEECYGGWGECACFLVMPW